MIFKDYYVQIPVNTINDNIVASVIQADHRSNRINATLIENRKQLDLTDASMVTVEIKKPNGSEVLGMADIIDPEKGRVRYTIMPGSIEVLGMHRLTFNVYSKDEDGEIINITSAYLFYDVREKLVVGDDIGESSEYPILIQLIQDINKIHEQYKEFEAVTDEIIIAEQERVQAEIERKQSEIDREQNEAKRELLYQQMDDLKNQLETIKTTLQGWLDNPEQFRGPEGPQGIQGEVGPMGKSLEYNWDGTKLGVKVEGDQDYGYTDLKGEQGIQGPPGNIDNLDKDHVENALGYIPANEDDLNTIKNEGYITTERTIDPIISNPADITEGMIKINAKGRTIVNSVYNGNFKNGTDGWLVSNSTIQASDNVLSVTGTGSFSFVKISQIIGRPEVGKRYFGRVVTRVTNDECRELIFQLGQSSTYGHIIKQHSEPEANIWYSLYGVIDITDQTELMLMISHSYSSKELSKDKVMEVKDVILLDLDNHPDLQGITAEQINERVPSYVDGVQGSDGLLVRSVGKNIIPSVEEWYFHTTTGEHANTTTRIRTGKIRIKPSTKYSIKHNQGYKFVLYSYNRTGEYNLSNSFIEWQDASQGFLFESDETTSMISIGIRFDENTTDIYPSELLNIKMQLEEGTEPTEYEPYQESSAFIMKGLYQLPNGVRDEIVDNRLVNKTSKKCLDGTESWLPFGVNGDSYIGFVLKDFINIYNAKVLVQVPNYNAICTLGSTYLYPRLTVYPAIEEEQFSIHNDGGLYLRILRSRLPSANVQGLKEYLADNNLTIIFELAEPKVKQLNLPINAYKNGHVMIDGWTKYKLKQDNVKSVTFDSNTSNVLAVTSFPHEESPKWNSQQIDCVYIPDKQQFVDKWSQYVYNPCYIGKYFTSTAQNIGFVFESGTDLYKAKQHLEGTKVYYKLGSEYWVQPEWSVTYPTTLLSQIKDNSKAISKLNEITQEHSDIIATHGIRIDAMQGIVESGENANGRYVRFADGTQICYGNKNYNNVNFTTSWGSLKESGELEKITFPATFISSPKCSFLNASTAGAMISSLRESSLTSSQNPVLIRGTETTVTTFVVEYIAIGRWK